MTMTVCFYLQTVMESVLVMVQAFTINGNDRVCHRASFYFHALVVFLLKQQVFTMNGSDGVCKEANFYIHAVLVCF